MFQKIHLFREARATPQLSFAVRALAGVAGVVISASHNPPSDNGFKVYWSDGGQVVSPHDKKIIAEVRAVGEIVRCDFNRALEVGLVVFGIGLSLGGTTGYAINPARDLGPRIAHAVLPIPGKRDSDWSYAVIPVAGPLIGAVLAAWLAGAL